MPLLKDFPDFSSFLSQFQRRMDVLECSYKERVVYLEECVKGTHIYSCLQERLPWFNRFKTWYVLTGELSQFDKEWREQERVNKIRDDQVKANEKLTEAVKSLARDFLDPCIHYNDYCESASSDSESSESSTSSFESAQDVSHSDQSDHSEDECKQCNLDKKNVTKTSFQTIQMVHDGNCLFRCISYALFGIQGEFAEVKANINKYVIKNWIKFRDFVLDDTGQPFKSLSAYRIFAWKRDRYGDFTDIVAASECFSCPINIFKGDDVTFVGSDKKGNPINLIFSGSLEGGFYDFLEQSDSNGSRCGQCRSYARIVGSRSPATAGVAYSSPSAFGFTRGHSVSGPAPGPASRATSSRRGSSVPLTSAAKTANKLHYPQAQERTAERGRFEPRPRKFKEAKSQKDHGNSGMQPLNSHNSFQILTEQPEEGETLTVVCHKANGKVHTRLSTKQTKIKKEKARKREKSVDKAEMIHNPTNIESQLSMAESPRISAKDSNFDSEDEENEDELELIANIDVRIENHKVSSLVDTGASVNCIDYDTLKIADPQAKIQSSKKKLQVANKQKLKTYGIWKGKIKIGSSSYTVKFYVCRGISQNMILGNPFLLKAKAKIDYERMQITLKDKTGKFYLKFGVFYKPVNNIRIFKDMDVEALYTGPQFVMPSKTVTIPPKTIKWVKINITPHYLTKETVFVGNPNLWKHYGLVVSDFILAPEGTKYVQVSNLTGQPKKLNKELNLAVDEENADLFYSECSINEIIIGQDDKKCIKFNINPNLTPEQRVAADKLLNAYKDVFVNDVSELKLCKYPPIKFDFDKGKIVRQRNYRMSPDEKEFAEGHIEKLLGADLIEICTSVYCTPILVVPKQTDQPGKANFRMVQDFRRVNKVLTDIKYPIPDQQELIDSFQGKFWHSVTDNCSGYTQLTLDPSCRDITAFDSPSGTRYRWKGMPQGLSIAPAFYALAMDHLLMEMKKKKKVVNYFDDTHLGTETFEEHLNVLREYFELLRKHRIQLNIRKSTFFQQKVKFLGLELDGNEMRILEKRVRAIRNLERPKDKQHVSKVLGVFGYNRRFIKNFGKIALPIQELLKKEVEFVWNEKHQQAFDELKSILSNPPALKLFDPKRNNRICCDASYTGLGVAFYQQDPVTKRFHPVAFASRKLKASEVKLPIYYLECLALVYAFVVFRCYIQNRNVETEVLTDHQSLQSLLKSPKPEGVIAKHIMFLSQFKFTIKYRPGQQNMDADSLSRCPVDNPSKTVDEMVDEVFPDRIAASTVSPVTTRAQRAKEQVAKESANELDKQNVENLSEGKEILTRNPLYMKFLQQQDTFITNIIEILSQNEPKHVRFYAVKDELLYRKEGGKLLLVVPDKCRKYVLAEFHDNRGHRKTKHLIKNLLDIVWWSTLRKDCQMYVKSCRYCSLHTENKCERPGFLAPTVAKRPFSQVACDFVGKLPTTKRKNQHFCVIVDYYTKYMWTRAVKNADTANAINCLSSFSMQFGLCESYTSDSASYFTSFAFEKVLEKWNIFHNAFRRVPHCNGQVERSIKSLKEILENFLLSFGEEWDEYLELATFLYNINYHDTIQCSPFYATHGFNPLTPGILQLLPKDDEILVQKLEKHKVLLKNLNLRIRKAQTKNKRYYDKNRKAVSYSIGQIVRVRNEERELGWPEKKIFWKGPFKIVGKRSNRFYFVLRTVRTASGKKKHVVKEYHVRNIRAYHKRPKSLSLNSLVELPQDMSGKAVDMCHVTFRNSTRIIAHKTGNVLNARLDQSIAHCISADVHLGAGLAKTIERYFKVRSVLKSKVCNVGDAILVDSQGKYIYNLVTKQWHYEKPKYKNLEKALVSLRDKMLANRHRKLCIPAIGCGLDQLKLSKVISIIESVFRDTEIFITMCHYDPADKSDGVVTDFRREYGFLSNLYECQIKFNGKIFDSVEHAYQATKANNPEDSEWVRSSRTPKIAKLRGNDVPLRSDWDEIKLNVMFKCVKAKFAQNSKLLFRLLQTGDLYLIAENYNHDQLYGSCRCEDHCKVPGENHLGYMLMELRKRVSEAYQDSENEGKALVLRMSIEEYGVS